MEITEVKVFPVDEDKLKAFVSVVFDHCFMVNDIKIIQGRQGFFISMPSRRKKNGEFKDVAHPLNNETRQRIEALVLSEYDRVLERRDESVNAVARQRSVGEPTDRAAAPRSVEDDSAATDWGGPRVNGDRRRAPMSPSRSEPVPLAAAAVPDENNEEAAGTTLEEVQELHLRDSFWTVP